jgi:predicted CoA-substrate-specific enzyme activase
MITAGIDVGAKTLKVLLLDGDKVLGKSMVLTGFDQAKSADKAFSEALNNASLKKEDVKTIMATGVGKNQVEFATDQVTDISADAKGANFLMPNVKTVIDVGAEEGRAIKCDGKGKVIDFVVNEKCAAGAGAFTEAMARAIEVKLEEMGPLSLKSTNAIPMNAQCAVFAESEVVTLIHAKTAKEDIAKAIHDAIADRIGSMTRRLAIEQDIALIGGCAHNIGFVESLKADLNSELNIPDEPEFVSALGAALIARDRASGG